MAMKADLTTFKKGQYLTSNRLQHTPIKFGYQYYFIHKRIINRWVKAGKLPAIKHKNKYLINKKDFIKCANMFYFPRQ